MMGELMANRTGIIAIQNMAEVIPQNEVQVRVVWMLVAVPVPDVDVVEWIVELDVWGRARLGSELDAGVFWHLQMFV